MRFPLTSFVLYPANESVESLEDQYSYVFRQRMLSKCISNEYYRCSTPLNCSWWISKKENPVTQMNQRQKGTWEITLCSIIFYSTGCYTLHWCNVSLIAIGVFQIPIWLWPFTAMFHNVVVQSHRERTRIVCHSNILPDISNMQTKISICIWRYWGPGFQHSEWENPTLSTIYVIAFFQVLQGQ